MGKTRVHLLAKELGIETKDLIGQLDKLGMRGRKAQSSLEDDEVTRIRAALAVQEKPQVHVGEEKVVADRVVKSEDESLGEVQARETIVDLLECPACFGFWCGVAMAIIGSVPIEVRFNPVAWGLYTAGSNLILAKLTKIID